MIDLEKYKGMTEEEMYNAMSVEEWNAYIWKKRIGEHKKMVKEKIRSVVDILKDQPEIDVQSFVKNNKEYSCLCYSDIQKVCNKLTEYRNHREKTYNTADVKKTVPVELRNDTISVGNDTFTISDHAINRIRQRIPEMADKTNTKIRKWIKRIFEKGNFKECHVYSKNAAIQILNHNFETSRYFKSNNGAIFVVAGGFLKTVHMNESGRFRENVK